MSNNTFINDKNAELNRSISECNREIASLQNRISFLKCNLDAFQKMKADHLNQARTLNAQFGFEGSFLSSGDYAMLAHYDNNISKCYYEQCEIEDKIRQYNQRKSNDEVKKSELEALLLKTEKQRAKEYHSKL